ncbi:MAG: NAD(P)-dependent oxidoreductase [Pseudomonadota bacterium]
MKRVIVTGGSGVVGRFVVRDLLAHGYDVTIAGRTPSRANFPKEVGHRVFDLVPETDFSALVAGFDGLVHAAFSHAEGRYRGGEGADIADFWQRNYVATVRLFQAAEKAGLRRGVFLSSRAVYDAQPPGICVDENTPCYPDSHYGAMKLACERHLGQLAANGKMAIGFLRATGVYGRASMDDPHKWAELFADYLAGKTIQPRCGTEVHGQDLASAVRLMLELPQDAVSGEAFNVSDLLLDRSELVRIVQRLTGSPHAPPHASDPSNLNVASTAKLAALGWRAGGMPRLEAEIARLIA